MLLRREPSRVAACVQYLQEVSGLSSKEVFKVFLSWPLMATSSKELFVTRCGVLHPPAFWCVSFSLQTS